LDDVFPVSRLSALDRDRFSAILFKGINSHDSKETVARKIRANKKKVLSL
jgi:hypothetical protein